MHWLFHRPDVHGSWTPCPQFQAGRPVDPTNLVVPLGSAFPVLDLSALDKTLLCLESIDAHH